MHRCAFEARRLRLRRYHQVVRSAADFSAAQKPSAPIMRPNSDVTVEGQHSRRQAPTAQQLQDRAGLAALLLGELCHARQIARRLRASLRPSSAACGSGAPRAHLLRSPIMRVSALAFSTLTASRTPRTAIPRIAQRYDHHGSSHRRGIDGLSQRRVTTAARGALMWFALRAALTRVSERACRRSRARGSRKCPPSLQCQAQRARAQVRRLPRRWQALMLSR